MSYKDLQIWLKQKRKSRLKPHTKMPGVCAKWQNQAYDFALSFGKVPCRFKDKDDILNDLIPDFIVCSWVFYVSLMVCNITCISVSSIVVCIRAYSSPRQRYTGDWFQTKPRKQSLVLRCHTCAHIQTIIMLYRFGGNVTRVTGFRRNPENSHPCSGVSSTMAVSSIIVCIRAYLRVYELVVCEHVCAYTNHNHVIPVQPLRVCYVMCVWTK